MSERKKWSPSDNLTARKEPAPWNPISHMQEYINWMKGELRAQGYIRKVRISIGYYAEYLRSEGITHPDEIRRSHIIRFKGWLNQQVADGRWSQTYATQHMVNTRTWMYWLERMEYIEEQPFTNIRVETYYVKPNPLSDEELAILFETHRKQMFSMPPFYWHRREVIITLLYGWALQVGELVELDCDQMDERFDFVRVLKADGARKDMPYVDPIKPVVQRWLRVRSRHGNRIEDALLIDKSGSRLGIDMVRKVVAELGRDASVKVNPHRLRETFGVKAISSDMDLEHVSKLLGHHSKYYTREVFKRANNPELYDAHEQIISDPLHDLLGLTPRQKGSTP